MKTKKALCMGPGSGDLKELELCKSFKNGSSWSLFQCFRLFDAIEGKVNLIKTDVPLNFADCGIRTEDLWYRKRLRCQLHHNRCPTKCFHPNFRPNVTKLFYSSLKNIGSVYFLFTLKHESERLIRKLEAGATKKFSSFFFSSDFFSQPLDSLSRLLYLCPTCW